MRTSSSTPAATTPRYHRLASEIAGLIDRGTLRSGDRVPSVRKLKAQSGVSVSTVLHAYQILERDGLIEARPQSGYYVRSNRPVTQSKPIAPSTPPATARTVSMTHWITRINRDMCDPALVPLGGAHPSIQLLPIRQLLRIQSVEGRLNPRGIGWYESVIGAPELRREIARHMLNGGCRLAEDELIITNGCQEALVLCLAAIARRGDTIAVESPAYFGVLQALEAQGMKALELPTDPREGIDPDALRRAARRRQIKGVILNANHHNPLGFVMSEDRKRDIVGIIQKHNLPLIEDDCYGDLGYALARPAVIKKLDDSGLVMLCSGFSKTLAPGMRIGWCAPGKWREKIERLKFCTSICAPTLSQLTIARYLQQGGYERYLRRVTRTYQTHVRLAADAIVRSFPQGTKLTEPRGGYVVWVEMPKRVNAMELYERCIADGICVAPGPMFSPSGRYAHCIRLSVAYPWTSELERAIHTIGRLATAMAAGATSTV